MSDALTLVLTGAESSGKTTLATALAAHFGAPLVPEYARSYLEGRASAAGDYSEADVLAIADGQRRAEATARAAHAGLLVADTDLLVILIWLRERYGRVPAWIDAELQPRDDRAYVLAVPDMPWQPDPLREHPHARMRLHGLYREALEGRGLPFIEVAGGHAQRLAAVVDWLARRASRRTSG